MRAAFGKVPLEMQGRIMQDLGGEDLRVVPAAALKRAEEQRDELLKAVAAAHDHPRGRLGSHYRSSLYKTAASIRKQVESQ